ncbi:alpha/beta fold hydrolase [Stakelama tenebrarum]|uniref:Alpha/beta hydrolase n=1 Tax=Stakelama tenebrarum TaxID=2711215 RepID=A0A6G6Y3J5_9SPHN|nr:alpha/beta hydrolase [Sphingosinithalassobacter tenebrarum]QIG79183.1 alpha/beta hydrolase [Sphingosinithalassobacter tenebrarum]
MASGASSRLSNPGSNRVALSTGVTLNVAAFGDPTMPAVILLHGFPESHRSWRHQMLALGLNHFVVAPDQRGFGKSSKPEGVEAYEVAPLMQDVIALADALEIREFTVIGHDFGGSLAWALALRFPERVRRLVTINGPHPLIMQRKLIEDADQRAASQHMRRFREMALHGDPDRAELEAFFQDLLVNHLRAQVSDAERERYLAEWSEPGRMTAMLHWYRAARMAVPRPGERADRPRWIDGPFPLISQPTLVLWGMRDRGLLPCLLDGLEHLAPDLSVIRIPEAGHFPQWETPEAVTRALTGWLKRRPPRPYKA